MAEELRSKAEVQRFIEHLLPPNVDVRIRQLQERTLPVVATGSLPAAAASMDGKVLIEDVGAGDRNLVVYAGGQRFRIDGGAAF